MALPNMRLKAGGRSQVWKSCVASLAILFVCRSTSLRPRARRPQLKRDPLGVTEALVRLRLLLLCCVLCVLPRRLSAQAVPLIATRGLDLLVKGQPDSAVALWTRTWTSTNDVGKAEQVLGSFRQLPQIAGSPLGYDLIRTVDVTPHLTRAYFLLRCERQPVYFLLVLYEAKDQWVVGTVNWNTDADHVLPPNLFGVEHPIRP
jgi:hypothetical protein